MVRTGLIALALVAAACKGNTKPADKQAAKVDEPPPPPPPEPRIPAGDAHVALPKIDAKAGRHVGTATAFVAITKDGTVTQGKVGTGADPYAGKPHTGRLEDELFGSTTPPSPPPPPADPDDPWAARQQAIDQARQAGILGTVGVTQSVYAELDAGTGALDVLVLADRDAPVDHALAAIGELAKHKIGLAIDGGGTPDAVQFRFAAPPTTTETPLGYVTFYDTDVSVSRPDSRGGANIPIIGATFDTTQLVSTLRPSVMTPMSGEVSVQLARTTTVQQLADVLAALGTIGAPRVLIAPMPPTYDDQVYGGLLGNEAGTMDGGFGYGYNNGTGGGLGIGTIGGHGAVPQVKIGQPNTVGDLDKAIIRRYIKRNIAKITYCYEKQLLVTPDLKGTVKVQFFINPDGFVSGATADGVDAEVASCVATVIEAIEFPKPKGGGGVQVNYPFTFKQAGG